MGWLDTARCLGCIGNIVVIVAFCASVFSNSWVLFDNGNSGLWNECLDRNNTKTNITKRKKKDDEMQCTHLDITELEAYIHVTRALVIISGFVYGFACIRGLHYRCMRYTEINENAMKIGFVCNLIAAKIGWWGLWTFSSYYGDDCKHNNCRLGMSYYSALAAVYVSIPATFLLVLRPIKDKWKGSWCRKTIKKKCNCLTCFSRVSTDSPTEESRRAHRSRRTSIAVVRISPAQGDWDGQTSESRDGLRGGVSDSPLPGERSRRSSEWSVLFAISPLANLPEYSADTPNPASEQNQPAPPYESVVSTTIQVPPPAYDEVIGGAHPSVSVDSPPTGESPPPYSPSIQK